MKSRVPVCYSQIVEVSHTACMQVNVVLIMLSMVQDLKTGSNLKNETATVTVINNFTANIGAGTNKQTANGDSTIFKNISAPNGSFSKVPFSASRNTSNNYQSKFQQHSI